MLLHFYLAPADGARTWLFKEVLFLFLFYIPLDTSNQASRCADCLTAGTTKRSLPSEWNNLPLFLQSFVSFWGKWGAGFLEILSNCTIQMFFFFFLQIYVAILHCVVVWRQSARFWEKNNTVLSRMETILVSPTISRLDACGGLCKPFWCPWSWGRLHNVPTSTNMTHFVELQQP